MIERQLIVGLDVDDVLIDLVPRWLEEYNEKWDDNLQTHDITDWDFYKFVKPECGKRIYSLLRPTMYDWVEPVPGAAEFVQDIRDRGHTPRYITHCGAAGTSHALTRTFATAKWNALIRHGIAQDGELLLPSRDKSRAPVDMLVDDKAQNVIDFRNGMGVLFTQPWNAWKNTDEETWVERADSFTEVIALIDYYKEEGP